MHNVVKIIILDDNVFDSELIKREIVRSGIDHVSRIVSTKDAFEELLINFGPDIVISDFNLNTFNALEALKIKNKICPDIPFIIISGSLREKEGMKHFDKGITDFLSKKRLYTLPTKILRSLKEFDRMMVNKRNEVKIDNQYKTLNEIADLQSHQMRVPIVHIRGLYDLFNFDDPTDPINAEVLIQLKKSAEVLDEIIKNISTKIVES